MDHFDEHLKSEFIVEARELLDSVEGQFLRLERDPSDKGIIDHIFRLAHTVKGSAYAVGFEELGTFAHTFETLLNRLREGKAEINPATVDLLLRSNDVLKNYIEVLSTDLNGTVDVSDVNADLLEAIGHDEPKKWDGPAFGFFDDDPPAAPNAEKKNEKPHCLETRLSSVSEPIILIVDDEPSIIEIVRDIIDLSFPKVKVISVSGGLEALDKMKTCTPHLIISDLKMPSMSGIEFIREVRKHNDRIPVIFLSGCADRGNIVEFIKLGAVDFHDKPIDIERFTISIENALKTAQIREGIIQLSTLTFKTFMAMEQVEQLLSTNLVPRESSQKIKNHLDDIAALTNFILGL